VEKPPARNTRSRRAANWSPTQVGRYETVSVSKRTSSQTSKKAAQKRPVKKEKPKPVPIFAPGSVLLNKQVDDITSFPDNEGHVGLLAATMDGLYRTLDESKGWAKVTITGYEPDGRVFSVSTHKDTPRKIFAGTKKGLFISNDGGETWQ